MLGEKRPQKSRGFSRTSPQSPQAIFLEPKNAPSDLPRLRENLSPSTSPANLPSSMTGGCGSGVQLHSRGDVSASAASTRPSSPAELAPATSAAPEAEVATASSLEPGDHGISAGDDHTAAERCPDGVWEAIVKKFPDLDKAWKSKESGGEQLQIRATDSLVDEYFSLLPLLYFSLLPLLRCACLSCACIPKCLETGQKRKNSGEKPYDHDGGRAHRLLPLVNFQVACLFLLFALQRCDLRSCGRVLVLITHQICLCGRAATVVGLPEEPIWAANLKAPSLSSTWNHSRTKCTDGAGIPSSSSFM